MMIWWTLALFAVSFFASVLLAPKPEMENARPGKLGDIKFPMASEGSPVPVIYGRVRLRSPNCIWYGNFKTRVMKKKTKTGMFSSKKVVTGYRYYVGFHLALCCGPDVVLRKIWCEKKVLWSSGVGIGPAEAAFSIDATNLFGGSRRGGGFKGDATFYGGQFTQARNSYLEEQVDANIPGYVGIAHIVFERPYIGTAPQLRPLSFELERYPDELGLDPGDLTIGDDLNPMEIMYAAITEKWGGINADPSSIDTVSWIAAGATLAIENNGMSLAVTSSNSGKSIVEEVLRQVDGILYQDPATGKIVMKLIREDYSVGTLPVLDESNIVQFTDYSRTSWGETTNQVRVKFTNRVKKYETSSALVQDMANVNMQGQIRSATIAFPGCTNGSLGVALASREMSQLSVPLSKVSIRANREAANLRPGSPFVLNLPTYGIAGVVMRVQRFDLGELLQGEIMMSCMQDKFAASASLYTIEDSLWVDPERAAVNITDFLVCECPYWILNRIDSDEFEIVANSAYFFGLARAPENMQRYDFITSDDIFIDNVVTAVDQSEFNHTALLQYPVPLQQGQPDGLISKIVIKEVTPDPYHYDPHWELDDILYDRDVADVRDKGRNLFMLNGEIFGYETYTSLGDRTYELENVHRALLDTQYEDHAVDDVIYFLDGVDQLSKNPRSDVGTIQCKFLSYSDQDNQDLDDVGYSSITANQRYDRPLPPDQIEVDSLRCPIEVVGQNTVQITDFLQRNRTAPDQVVLVPDSTDTPEGGTTYTARFYLDGVLVDTISPAFVLSGLPVTFTGLSGAGIGRIEIEAIVGGLESWKADFVEFWFAYYQNLGSELVTDGDMDSLTNWTEQNGSWDRDNADYPLDRIWGSGSYAFTNGTGAHELRQDITVSSYQGQMTIFRVWKGALDFVVQSQVTLELRDGVGILDSITTDLTISPWGEWEMVEIAVPISSTAVTARIKLLADEANATFDEATLKPNTVSIQTATKYDTVSGLTVQGAWGLRQLDSGHSGALVRIRDTHDDSELDIGQDEDGNLEMFWTRGEARVVTLYDQSGNNADLVADADADQPRLRHGLGETARPSIDFAGTGVMLRDTQVAGTGLAYMVTRPNMSLVIGPRITEQNSYIATIPHMDGSHTSPYKRWGMGTGDNDWRFRFNEADHIDAGNGDPDTTSSIHIADAYNGALYHNDDATAAYTWTPADTTYPEDTRLRIGETSAGGQHWDGQFHELCIYTGDVAAGDRKTLMEAIALYWYNLSV